MSIFNKIANFRENLSHRHWNIDILIMVLKVYRFQKPAFSLTVHGVNWRQHRRNCRSGKTKTDKMVFKIEDFVLIKVLCQEKGLDNS